MDLRTIAFASVCLSVASLGFLPAADAPPPPPATTVAADIDLGELDLRLRPLTASELKVEADGWLALVKEKAKALSDVEIAAKKAEGDEKTKLLDEAQKLRDEQTRAIDRTKAVLAALVQKGGDAKDYGLYLDAVSSLKIEVKDTSAALTTVKNWLKSPEG